MLMTSQEFQAGLEEARQAQTVSTLGNRAEYVGSSDIGGCPRQAVLRKVIPQKHDLQTLIRFKRGHLAEDIVAEALRDFRPQRQAELNYYLPYCTLCEWLAPSGKVSHCSRCQEPLVVVPLRAHLDFLLPGNRILEVKSSNQLEIREAWEHQVHFQMLLLHKSTGKHVEAAIMVLDVNKGLMNMQNDYVYDPERSYGLLLRAIKIWEGVKTASQSEAPENLPLTCEPSALCGYCPYLATCPAHSGPELPQEVSALLEQYHQASEAEKAAKARKETLRDYVLKLIKPGTYQSGNLRIRLSERSRTTTDLKQLELLLGELGQDISEYQKTSKYAVLDVKAA
ncbi:PD-(D/E)XK nuclease family protein [Desulfonatronum parangueonense]